MIVNGLHQWHLNNNCYSSMSMFIWAKTCKVLHQCLFKMMHVEVPYQCLFKMMHVEVPYQCLFKIMHIEVLCQCLSNMNTSMFIKDDVHKLLERQQKYKRSNIFLTFTTSRWRPLLGFDNDISNLRFQKNVYSQLPNQWKNIYKIELLNTQDNCNNQKLHSKRHM